MEQTAGARGWTRDGVAVLVPRFTFELKLEVWRDYATSRGIALTAQLVEKLFLLERSAPAQQIEKGIVRI